MRQLLNIVFQFRIRGRCSIQILRSINLGAFDENFLQWCGLNVCILNILLKIRFMFIDINLGVILTINSIFSRDKFLCEINTSKAKSLKLTTSKISLNIPFKYIVEWKRDCCNLAKQRLCIWRWYRDPSIFDRIDLLK